jgi:hypothetical protein
VKPGAAPDLTATVAQIRELASAALAGDVAEAEARRFAKQLSGVVDKDAPGAASGLMTPPPQPVAQPAGGGFFGGGIFGGEPAPGGADGGDGQLGVQPVMDPDAVPGRACRHNAWRLVSLADAIQPEASKDAGIASVLAGDAAAKAIELATVLRAQGLAIETAPDEASVKAALEAIAALASPAQPDDPGAAEATPAQPAPPTTPPANSPFGAPGESSPF